MEPTKGMSLDEFIHRKLQPLKVLVGMLNREMELNPGDSIALGRAELDNLLTTLELFIEDYERVSTVKSKRMQPRPSQFIDQSKPKPPIKQIA